MLRPKPILYHLAKLFCFIALASPQAALADDTRILELTDGSVISGQIISLENGVYTIASPTLGRLQVKDSEILSLRSRSVPPRAMLFSQQMPNGGQSTETFTNIQKQIMAEPEILSLVMSLQQNPEILAILNDPAIMRAIATRDMESLQNNPKIRQLEGNPTIRKILGRLNR